MRTANEDKDNSQLNQYLLTAFDFPTQCGRPALLSIAPLVAFCSRAV